MENKDLAETLHHIKLRREDQESNLVVWKNKIREAEKSQSTIEEKANLLLLKSELQAIEFDLLQRNREFEEYAVEALEALKREGCKPLESMRFDVNDADNSFIEILYDKEDKVFVNGPVSRW